MMILPNPPTHHLTPAPQVRLSKARVWTFVDGAVLDWRDRRSEASRKGWQTRRHRRAIYEQVAALLPAIERYIARETRT